jgi:predicted DNA-binding transcriptional regulator AlpA
MDSLTIHLHAETIPTGNQGFSAMRNVHNQSPPQTARYNLKDIEVARYLDVSLSTVRRWRLVGGGPRWIRIGASSIRYPLVDLETYVAGLPSGGGPNAGGTVILGRGRA